MADTRKRNRSTGSGGDPVPDGGDAPSRDFKYRDPAAGPAAPEVEATPEEVVEEFMDGLEDAFQDIEKTWVASAVGPFTARGVKVLDGTKKTVAMCTGNPDMAIIIAAALNRLP